MELGHCCSQVFNCIVYCVLGVAKDIGSQLVVQPYLEHSAYFLLCIETLMVCFDMLCLFLIEASLRLS